jgi:hypothetical protein
MAIQQTFRMKATAAVLSGLMVLTAAMPFNVEAQEPQAQEPATTAPDVATAPANTNTPSTQETMGPMAKAVMYSNEGIGFLFVQGNNDNYDYRPLLKTLKQTMGEVPAKFYGAQSNKPETFIIFFAKGIPYTGYPIDEVKEDNLKGYKPDDIRNGRVTMEATRAYEQAFLE